MTSRSAAEATCATASRTAGAIVRSHSCSSSPSSRQSSALSAKCPTGWLCSVSTSFSRPALASAWRTNGPGRIAKRSRARSSTA